MNNNFLRKAWFFVPVCSIALVVACGGGTPALTDSLSLSNKLTSALAAISASPSNYSAFISLLDSSYKQDGLSSADLSAMLAADAAALPNDVSFPSAAFSNPTITNCNASNVCDLIVTVTNADADTVSTTVTLKVIGNAAGYKLIGDQSTS